MTATMTPRMQLVARLPWVTRLDEAHPCDGYRWSHMPLKAIYGRRGQPPDPAELEKYRCRKSAWWKFEAIFPSTREAQAPDGIYCWQHLFSLGLRANMAEDARFQKAARRLREQIIAEQETGP